MALEMPCHSLILRRYELSRPRGGSLGELVPSENQASHVTEVSEKIALGVSVVPQTYWGFSSSLKYFLLTINKSQEQSNFDYCSVVLSSRTKTFPSEIAKTFNQSRKNVSRYNANQQVRNISENCIGINVIVNRPDRRLEKLLGFMIHNIKGS